MQNQLFRVVILIFDTKIDLVELISSVSDFCDTLFRVCAEILDFCDFLSPTAEEQESRNAALKSVFDVINYIWPNAVVH